MKIMTETTNGFEFENARFRGEIFGTRQSGIPGEVADLVEDYPILEEARKVAGKIVAARLARTPRWHLLALFRKERTF